MLNVRRIIFLAVTAALPLATVAGLFAGPLAIELAAQVGPSPFRAIDDWVQLFRHEP